MERLYDTFVHAMQMKLETRFVMNSNAFIKILQTRLLRRKVNLPTKT